MAVCCSVAMATIGWRLGQWSYPVRAVQGWTRQSLRPILGAESLKAVLISGTDRQLWRERVKGQELAGSRLHKDISDPEQVRHSLTLTLTTDSSMWDQ